MELEADCQFRRMTLQLPRRTGETHSWGSRRDVDCPVVSLQRAGGANITQLAACRQLGRQKGMHGTPCLVGTVRKLGNAPSMLRSHWQHGS